MFPPEQPWPAPADPATPLTKRIDIQTFTNEGEKKREVFIKSVGSESEEEEQQEDDDEHETAATVFYSSSKGKERMEELDLS